MSAQEIAIASLDGGSFSAYVATPTAGAGAGVIVIQEIFGVNQVMRRLADSYAAAGYLAIVPDLFWRQQPQVQLNDHSDEDWNKALQLFQGFDENKGVEDLIATLNALRQLPECTGKVGSVGFCLGGKLAYLMATHSDAECNVGYYGVGIENNLDETSKIQQPLMLHIAENDQFVPPEAQATIRVQMSGHPKVTVYSYTSVSHAFAREGSQSYDQEAAQLANSRTMKFLQRHLS